MDPVLPIIAVVLGVLLVNAVAARFGAPAPILLVATGFAVSFVPGVPGYEISPELVLTVLLPPLLYAAAVESSAVAIRQLLRPIFQLAVVLVLLTAFTVAFVLTALIPAIPFAAALALGAIVAPPDAVAAVALARRIGLPRRLVTVLEGESLFNDATSLVTLKVAIGAIGVSSIAWAPAVGQFAWASVGGIGIGAALGLALSWVRRTAQSALSITVLSLITPFAAYLIGEAVHSSGVLVVVVTGLVLGYRSPIEVPASVRLTETATWAALRFVLEGAVFALIGLQLRGIFVSLDTGDGMVFLAIGAVLLTVIVSRPVWLVVIHLVSKIGRSQEVIGWRGVAAVSWAGMRGVVSLAAAQTLPMDTPYRSLLLVCTIAVIIGTLVLQGATLPWVIRRLDIAQDHRADDQAERAKAHAAVSSAIESQVDSMVGEGKLSERQAALMRKWAALRDWRNWDDDDESREFGRRLSVLSDWRRSLLGVERTVIVSMRNSGELTEDVLREMQHDLDLEEALLERRSDAVDGHLAELPEEQNADRSGNGSTGDRAAGPVDPAAAVDDADVSAVLGDEQPAASSVIGQRAAGPGWSPR
jgi:CPA1 family monovalent cation:H+ antiporter